MLRERYKVEHVVVYHDEVGVKPCGYVLLDSENGSRVGCTSGEAVDYILAGGCMNAEVTPAGHIRGRNGVTLNEKRFILFPYTDRKSNLGDIPLTRNMKKVVKMLKTDGDSEILNGSLKSTVRLLFP